MIRVGSKMHVFKGYYDEYKKRHDKLWPEMREQLAAHGYRNYSIFLDEETGDLFSYVEVENTVLADEMSKMEICKKWWHYMKDIMETNPDESPISKPLKNVFILP